MKTVAILLACLGVAATAARAQTNQTDVLIGQADVPMEKIDRYVRFQAHTVNRLFGVNINYGGVFPMARQAENSWQIINPFAPMEYGDGFNNVSINPHHGRAEGLFLFAIKF
jgi:hypothetical protein